MTDGLDLPAAGGVPPRRPSRRLEISFEAFHEFHARKWLEYARLHTGDALGAEKLTQAVYQQLADHWAHVLLQPSVDSYAWTVFKEHIAEWFLNSGRSTTAAQASALAAVARVLLRKYGQQLALLEDRASSGGGMPRLPERQCDVVVLRFVIGYSDDRIGALLNVDETVVRSHVRHAKRRIVAELGGGRGPYDEG
ncbi:sigma factor-like helix-turn-helix DNA-binding protein [Streptomyces sp. NPDC057654]|uniref:sigma factor-like helix-turn-helix DNA-binding protein n=1 Tax=Streptomyces sp. NPDC057654 TaxID=3346196 RepID=UPI0036994380